jgi:hypothetical protein
MEVQFVDVLISLKVVGGVARLEFGKVSEMTPDKEGKPQIKVQPSLELLIPLAGLKEAVQSVSKSLSSEDGSKTTK